MKTVDINKQYSRRFRFNLSFNDNTSDNRLLPFYETHFSFRPELVKLLVLLEQLLVLQPKEDKLLLLPLLLLSKVESTS